MVVNHCENAVKTSNSYFHWWNGSKKRSFDGFVTLIRLTKLNWRLVGCKRPFWSNHPYFECRGAYYASWGRDSAGTDYGEQMSALQIKKFKETGDDLGVWIKHADIVPRTNEWNKTEVLFYGNIVKWWNWRHIVRQIKKPFDGKSEAIARRNSRWLYNSQIDSYGQIEACWHYRDDNEDSEGKLYTIDSETWWTEIRAISTPTTDVIIGDLMETCVQRHGGPGHLIIDRGWNLTSKIFQ